MFGQFLLYLAKVVIMRDCAVYTLYVRSLTCHYSLEQRGTTLSFVNAIPLFLVPLTKNLNPQNSTSIGAWFGITALMSCI